MSSRKCLQCGGGGQYNWYECVCDAPAASAESIAEVESRIDATIRRESALALLRSKSAQQFSKTVDLDASIILVCAIEDFEHGETLSRWLFFKRLISTPDGFSEMPTDADHNFHIRAVTVKGLGYEGHDELRAVFDRLDWSIPESASLMVRMDSQTFS